MSHFFVSQANLVVDMDSPWSPDPKTREILRKDLNFVFEQKMDVPPKLTLYEKIFDVGRPQREMIYHMMATTYQIQILFLVAVQRALFSPAG